MNESSPLNIGSNIRRWHEAKTEKVLDPPLRGTEEFDSSFFEAFLGKKLKRMNTFCLGYAPWVGKLTQSKGNQITLGDLLYLQEGIGEDQTNWLVLPCEEEFLLKRDRDASKQWSRRMEERAMVLARVSCFAFLSPLHCGMILQLHFY